MNCKSGPDLGGQVGGRREDRGVLFGEERPNVRVFPISKNLYFGNRGTANSAKVCGRRSAPTPVPVLIFKTVLGEHPLRRSNAARVS